MSRVQIYGMNHLRLLSAHTQQQYNSESSNIYNFHIFLHSFSLTKFGVVLDFWNRYKKRIPTDGKDPKGIAGALLYYLGKKYQISITQQQVVDVTKVTEITVRSRYKEILRAVEGYPSDSSVTFNMVGCRERVRSPI